MLLTKLKIKKVLKNHKGQKCYGIITEYNKKTGSYKIIKLPMLKMNIMIAIELALVITAIILASMFTPSAKLRKDIKSDSLVRYYSQDYYKLAKDSSIGIVNKSAPLPTELYEALSNIEGVNPELADRYEDIYQSSITVGINPTVGAAILNSLNVDSDRIKNMSKEDMVINMENSGLTSDVKVKELPSKVKTTVEKIDSAVDEIVDNRITNLWSDGEGQGKGITQMPTRDSKRFSN